MLGISLPGTVLGGQVTHILAAVLVLLAAGEHALPGLPLVCRREIAALAPGRSLAPKGTCGRAAVAEAETVRRVASAVVGAAGLSLVATLAGLNHALHTRRSAVVVAIAAWGSAAALFTARLNASQVQVLEWCLCAGGVFPVAMTTMEFFAYRVGDGGLASVAATGGCILVLYLAVASAVASTLVVGIGLVATAMGICVAVSAKPAVLLSLPENSTELLE